MVSAAANNCTPVQENSAVANWQQIAPGGYHTIALKSDKSLWLWGHGDEGQLANGTQLQTVGDHWKLSQALPDEVRSKLDRRGTCLACHKEMPSEDLAVSLLVHTAKYAGINVDNKMHHTLVNKSILMTAWMQVLGGLFAGLAITYWWLRRKRK